MSEEVGGKGAWPQLCLPWQRMAFSPSIPCVCVCVVAFLELSGLCIGLKIAMESACHISKLGPVGSVSLVLLYPWGKYTAEKKPQLHFGSLLWGFSFSSMRVEATMPVQGQRHCPAQSTCTGTNFEGPRERDANEWKGSPVRREERGGSWWGTSRRTALGEELGMAWLRNADLSY